MAKAKIPKRVAGVKVPKKVRRQAKKALKLAASPAVRDLALTGLTRAAERVLEEAKRSGGARPAADGTAKPGRLDLGAIIHAAVAEGARRFLAGFEEAAAAAVQPAPRPGARPRPAPAEESAKPVKKPGARPKPAPAKESAKPVKKRATAKPGESSRRKPDR